MTFLDHLELWDINANVSELGESYIVLERCMVTIQLNLLTDLPKSF